MVMSTSEYEVFFDDGEDAEPMTSPAMCVEPDATCGVCGVQNSLERPIRNVCFECGKATHDECGEDSEPFGGWDRDADVNYWVCRTCQDLAQQEMANAVAAGDTLGALVLKADWPTEAELAAAWAEAVALPDPGISVNPPF
jgi:hypothetical protein